MIPGSPPQLTGPSPPDDAGPVNPGAIIDPAYESLPGGPSPARLAAVLLICLALGGSALGFALWGGKLWRQITGGGIEAPVDPADQRRGPASTEANSPPKGPVTRLTEAEHYFVWWRRNGPNGRCTSPRCGRAMRVPTRGTARYLCPACGTLSPARSIRAMGTPPPPPTPPAAYILARGRR